MMKQDKANSRRSFLKTTSMSTMGLGLVPGFVWPLEKQYDMQQEPMQESGLTILFQGDSITDGNRGRNNDPNHIMGHGYAFSIASRWGADFPERQLQFYNRGISGNKVVDLESRWKEDALDLRPDVLSILIGINDTAAYLRNSDEVSSPESFESTYRRILDESLSQNEKLLLVLSLPFVVPVGPPKENWEKWRSDTQQRQTVIGKLAGEYGALLVDYPKAFEKAMARAPAEYWIWDGIHPTVAGHEIMAREWMSVVERRLSFIGE